ncbi:hypothetical protein MYX07_03270 [Patescibacteria group bacterium AH-259-L07]|nr:hypothetical protein [Patescibacteria group bacterium AH-259-L07]
MLPYNSEMWRYNEYIQVSTWYSSKDIDTLLSIPGVFFKECHVQYPADENRSHLLRFFSIEPLAQYHELTTLIAGITREWYIRANINYCDVIFAPVQPGVIEIVEILAQKLDIPYALLEYLPTGRFGNTLVKGDIQPGDRVLVFNGVTQQGNCVGKRLPEFVTQRGGEVSARAVFAKGTTRNVKALEERYGSRFFSSIQVDIPIYSAEKCPKCCSGEKASLRPWTDLF